MNERRKQNRAWDLWEMDIPTRIDWCIKEGIIPASWKDYMLQRYIYNKKI